MPNDLAALEEAVRKDDREALRRTVDAARARLLPSGGPRSSDPGAQKARTELVDALVRGLWERHAIGNGVTLIATGGYGRGELAPRSDVDLLVLRKDGAPTEPIEAFVRSLWDAGVEVGSAVRTLDQTEARLGSDLAAATATLEGRFLAGDEGLFAELVRRIEEGFLPKNAARFVRAKLDEASERLARRGGTIFLLAPDLKEGRGTLRDLELARLLAALAPWLGIEEARVPPEPGRVLGAFPRALEALARWLDLGPDRTRALERACALLAAVRAAVHELDPSSGDRLEKPTQQPIAERFGYRARQGRLGVENFLRDVFLAARAVDRTLRLARDRVEKTLEGARRAVRTQRLAPGITAAGTEVSLEPTAVTLENAAELFLIAQKTKRTVSLATREAVRRLLAADDAALDRFRSDPNIVRAFRGVLAGGTHVAATLRAMHDSGYLDELLPEFGALDCLAQADPYHAYTVDEHTLAAVAALEGETAAPDGGALVERPPLEREDRVREELFHRTARRDLLRLGILLHDAGKTGGNLGHVERGVALVPEAARRLGLSLDEERHVRFLVEHHLTLSLLVDKRDVDAPETRAEVLAACERDLEWLDHLYLMTVADVRAVSPRAFTRWKDTLLTRLWETAREEAQRGTPVHRAADEEEIVEELAPRLPPGIGEDDLREHLALAPRPYLVECGPDEILAHLELLAPLRNAPSVVRVVEEDGFFRLYVATRDKPRLFGALCGALAACGLDIVAAQAFTRKDGIVLDRFAVIPQGEPNWDEVRATIDRVLAGADLAPLLAARARRLDESRRAASGRRPPVRVRLSNKISAHTTVVDVTAPDRLGLLHAIATALSDAGLDIRLAKIATKGDRAVDVFYVTTTAGEKVTGAAALARVRRLVGAAARGGERS
ncbi:MAG TPA: ACT domain-containing protein [Planctomycetota bacterium]|nr:ACT domain-containing protein [Planctomycetota bacterium]